jgi:anti-sigma B factor antagonist
VEKLMHITEKIKNGVAIVSIKGTLLDEHDDSELQGKIRSLASDDIKRIVLDLSMVTRINSKGLSILIAAVDKMRRTGGDLRLAQIDKHLHDILTITKLVRVFGTYETVDRALASYRN